MRGVELHALEERKLNHRFLFSPSWLHFCNRGGDKKNTELLGELGDQRANDNYDERTDGSTDEHSNLLRSLCA